MELYDEQFNPLESYDPELGYISIETRVVEHIDAVPEQLPVYKTETVWEGDNGARLSKRVLETPYRPATPERDVTERIKVFHPYTAEELEEREQARIEGERLEVERQKAAQEAAERENERNALLDDLPRAIAEVATIAAEAKEAQEDFQQGQDEIMSAMGELACMIAEIQADIATTHPDQPTEGPEGSEEQGD